MYILAEKCRLDNHTGQYRHFTYQKGLLVQNTSERIGNSERTDSSIKIDTMNILAEKSRVDNWIILTFHILGSPFDLFRYFFHKEVK